ncbi:hypothetical protein [Mucilaginibacter gynuensis]|uniref:hypothetical protein n=1 Tax=Mucilaginibacter gynuensis TaxID=1302236 RepID=UPI0031EAD061
MKRYVPAISVIILVLVFVYQPIASLGFAWFDDDWMLLNHKLIHPAEFNIAYVAKVFGTFNSLQYSPLNTLCYYFIYQINAYDPYWFHLFCFLIHILNTGLVYKISKRLFGRFNVQPATRLAYICCVIWAIHPLNVESVVWISASKIPLFSFFNMLAMLAFINYVDTGNKANYWLSVIAFILSCFVKEQAVVLPVILIIYLICIKKLSLLTLKQYMFVLSPFIIVAIIFGIVTLIALKTAIGLATPISKYPFYQRIVFAFYCLCFYCFNFILPVDLHYHYSYPIKPNETLPWVYYTFIPAFIVLATAAWRYLRQSINKRLYAFGIGFFLAHLALCLQIIPLSRPAIMADRYMYLPTLGLLLILVPVGYQYVIQLINHKGQIFKLALAIVILVIAGLCIYSRDLVYNWNYISI